MDLGLAGKVALVAGSSRGLGKAVAEELGREGASLILCARGREALDETASGIQEHHRVPALAVPADLTEPAGVREVVRAGKDRFGQVDVLVTNTGGPPSGPFESHSPDDWRQAVRQNLDSVLNLVREVLPGMKERGWGRIVNVTSVAVKQPVDGLILSNSIRAAVTGFARTLANEVAEDGVTVNNVMPGFTRTERLNDLAEAAGRRQGMEPNQVFRSWEDAVPMGRLGEPHEFAGLVAFLASERASYITGTSVPVDGGWIRSVL